MSLYNGGDSFGDYFTEAAYRDNPNLKKIEKGRAA